MAGDWMMIDLELSDKPEVHQIAAALSIDPDAVVGKLVRVWSWFDKQTVDGHAPSVTHALLDRITARDGFAQAMTFAGWLDATNGGLTMPKFDRWNGQSAKKRALTNRRQQKKRNAGVTKMSRTERDKNVTREEKRIYIKEATPPDGGPVWTESLVVLTEQGLGEKTARAFLGMLCRQYEETAIVDAVKAAVGRADAKSYILGVLKAKPKKGEAATLRVAV